MSGIIQGDGRFFTSGSDKDVGSTFFLNRVRPILTGSLGKYYNFNITPDFGQGRVTLQDAYINMTYWDYASLRAGKFKAPFDLERLQSDRDLDIQRAFGDPEHCPEPRHGCQPARQTARWPHFL